MRKVIAIAGLLAFAGGAIAAVTASPGVTVTEVFATGGGDSIVSFDWGPDGSFYYSTGNFSPQMTVYRWDGSSATEIFSQPAYPGSWVACNGDYVYFTQDSDMAVYKYDTAAGGQAAVTLQQPGLWGIFFHAGEAFIVGSDALWQGTISHSAIAAAGELSAPSLLGTVVDPSGPMAFDAEGNLYYSAGYSQQRILKYSAGEVADAMAGGSGLGDPDGHVWASFTGTGDGATGMAFDADGALVLTATSFLGPAWLLSFAVANDGSNAGLATLLESDSRLGTVRLHDGVIHVNDGGAVYSVVPEPFTLGMLVAGVFAALIRRRARRPPGRE